MGKRKRNKIRRSFPKRFASDNIQVSRSPGKNHVPEKMLDLVDYRGRGKSLREEDDPLLRMFPIPGKVYTKEEVKEINKTPPIPKMPETGYQDLYLEDQSPPRFRVLELLEHWQSDRLRGFNEFKYFTILLDEPNRKLKLFHSGNKCCFVRETDTLTIRSIIYDSKERAMKDFWANKVFWYEVLK